MMVMSSTTAHITHLGLWRKLYNYSLHRFTASQCILNSAELKFSSNSNRLADIWKGPFNPRVGVIGEMGVTMGPFDSPPMGKDPTPFTFQLNSCRLTKSSTDSVLRRHIGWLSNVTISNLPAFHKSTCKDRSQFVGNAERPDHRCAELLLCIYQMLALLCHWESADVLVP